MPLDASAATPSAPAATTPASTASQAPAATEVKATDLVRRAAEEKVIPAVTEPSTQPTAEDILKGPSLDDIKDPTARAYVEKRVKDLERGYNTKFMSIAEEKKQVENLRLSLEQQTNKPWTTERVLELSKDPNFVNAAQQAIETQRRASAPAQWEGTAEEWSMLSESEKTAFRNLESKVNHLLEGQAQVLRAQDHEKVKTRFPDYAPEVVERIQSDLLAGKVPTETINEWIWKAHNFDRYIEQSYRFGIQDRNGTLQEKINGSALGAGVQAGGAGSPEIVPQEGESRRQLFRRIAESRLAQSKANAR